ncbi:DUF3253 domain-containing protein [Mucilaginibacter sp. CAU 1740]|uniref:DUF3253 domain-containing protein n=1 Tax=Mucilaginibacter sp. CAU 1740 TaxID=3140365 RepID=UPI00325A7548
MSVKPDIRQAILDQALSRGVSKTTCPSEIARALFPHDWRSYMEEIRTVALQMHKNGQIVITRKGVAIDNGPIKGPIRIGLKNQIQSDRRPEAD